jgi:ABC-2 type transport system permease protein
LKETTVTGREYKYIDFILPGQLGFSLLSSGVFGTAFVFISLRLTLVIKRFFATPVKRYSIVLGEAIARIVFSLLGALFIIMIGHYAFGFTLIHGVVTVLNMLVLCAIGLIIFMGFGLPYRALQKREYCTAIIKYYYAATVPTVGYFLFGNSIPNLAAACKQCITVNTFKQCHAQGGF